METLSHYSYLNVFLVVSGGGAASRVFLFHVCYKGVVVSALRKRITDLRVNVISIYLKCSAALSSQVIYLMMFVCKWLNKVI